MEEIQDLKEIMLTVLGKLEALENRLSAQPEQIKIYEALSAAQAEMTDIKFTGTNTYYHTKYATLSDLIAMTRKALSNHGLSVYQVVFQDDKEVNYLKTILAHASGEKIESVFRFTPNKNTAQQMGSYMAYIRRMAYASIVGCCVHDIDDDDAVACMEEYNNMIEKGTLPNHSTKEFDRISREEVVEIERSMGEHYDLGQNIIETYHLNGLADLPKSKYAFVLGQLRKNVARRNNEIL